jgi:hypothetical protein
VWLREMISKWLWLIPKFENRDERLDSEWQKYISTERPALDTAEKLNTLKDIFETYLTDPAFREIIDQKKYWELASYPSVKISEIQLVWWETLTAMAWYSHEYLRNQMKEFNYQS